MLVNWIACLLFPLLCRPKVILVCSGHCSPKKIIGKDMTFSSCIWWYCYWNSYYYSKCLLSGFLLSVFLLSGFQKCPTPNPSSSSEWASLTWRPTPTTSPRPEESWKLVTWLKRICTGYIFVTLKSNWKSITSLNTFYNIECLLHTKQYDFEIADIIAKNRKIIWLQIKSLQGLASVLANQSCRYLKTR